MTGGVTIRAVFAASLVAIALMPAVAAAEPGVVTEYPIPVETDPYAIATGPEGKIWFVDSGGHATGGTQIGRMTTAGAIGAAEVVPFPHPGLGQAIAFGPDGNMWAEEGERLNKVPLGVSATGQITAYEYPSHSGSNGYGSVAVGPDGRLWVGLTEQLAASTTSGEMNLYETEAGTGVSGITSGPGGELWFGAGNKIQRIATNGTHSGADVFPLPEGGGINDMTLGSDGNMWFTLGSPAAVGKITPAGAITLFRTPAASSLPFGIAAGPDGHMWFTEEDAGTVGSIPLTATSGSEIHEYPVPHANAGMIGIVAGPDNRMWFAESNANSLGAVTTGAPPPVVGGGSTPGSNNSGGSTTTGRGRVFPVNPAPVGCVAEKLSLLDVLAHAGSAHLTGVAPRSAVGQQVKIVSSWNGKVIGKAKVAANGSFSASVAAPPSRFRHGAKGSYAVEFGKLKSARVGYARRLYTTEITASGRTIAFVGSVKPPLTKPVAVVTIRAASTCAGIAKGAVVAKVTPGRSGAFSAKITLPASLEAGSSVYLRAETIVRVGRKARSTAGLVRGISLQS